MEIVGGAEALGDGSDDDDVPLTSLLQSDYQSTAL